MADVPAGGAGNPNDITVRIRGNADDLRNAVREADRQVTSFRERMAAVGQGGIQVVNIFKQIGNALTGVATMAGFAAILGQMREIYQVGSAFANQMEQTALGLKAIYAQQINVYDAQYNQVGVGEKLLVSQQAISEQIEKMKTDALVTTATLSQITGIFQMSLPVALSLGMSLDQTRGFVVSMVKTAGAMGVPMEHINMEVRDALQGYVQMEDRMLRSLGLTTEKLQQWKAMGPDALVANLLKKMEAFDVASKEAGDTWQGVTSSLQDFKEQLAGMIVTPAMDTLRKALIAIRDSLGEVKNGVFVFNETVQGVVGVLQGAFEQVAKAVVAVGAGLVDVAKLLSVLDQATGGMLKWVAAGYALLSVYQALRVIFTSEWFLKGAGILMGANPVMMWATIALVGLTAVAALWERMKGDVNKDLDEFDKRLANMQSEVDKSKQRQGGLSETAEKIAGMTAPGTFEGTPGEGVRRANEAGTIPEAVTAEEKEWVEKMKIELLPLSAEYKEIQELFDQKEFTKAGVLRAILKARGGEKETETDARMRKKVGQLELEKEIEGQIAIEATKAESLRKQLTGEEMLMGPNGELFMADHASVQANMRESEKRRLSYQERLKKVREAMARDMAENRIEAVPQETPQEKAKRERQEALTIEISLKRTLFGIEENLANVERARKLAATGYYLAIHDLQKQELKNLQEVLDKKVKDGQMTQELRNQQISAAHQRQAQERKDNVRAIVTGQMALQDVPVVVKQQSFLQQQRTEVDALRSQIQKDILTASAQMTRANQEVERIRNIADPMKKLELPQKEQEAKEAAAKYERTFADAEVRLLDLRKKQHEEAKAEEERILNHRKAMGQATEKDELDRLWRIANSENETYQARDKAAEQHFEKFKSLEQQLFDYRKGMGLVSMEMEINRLRAIAGAANRTAQERMAAEQKVYDLEQQLIEKRRGSAKNLVNMGKAYLKGKYGEQEANRGRSMADWGRVADEAIFEKQREYDRLKNSGVKSPEDMQKMYDLDKELSDLRKQRRELGTTSEQMEGGTVPTPAMDNFRRISHERDTLYNKANRTPEEEQRLKDLQAALPGAHKEANLEAQGETKTQREAAAGVSPASSAFAGVAKALGLDTLPGHASKAFEQVATSYTALLQKMEQEAAVAGSKINTLLYEGFVGRLKQDLTDEVNRS